MDVAIKDLNPVIQLLMVMTLFSLLPFAFCCMTSFLRFTIVFSMLKTAMGTQSVPPAMVPGKRHKRKKTKGSRSVLRQGLP